MKISITLAYLCLFSLTISAQTKIPLWSSGAPGSEYRKTEAETAKDWWVKNIHNPSINIYKPAKPNGTAVVIFPGGGFRELVYNAEGKEPAEFLNSLGITAIAVKYRLSGEEKSPYKLDEHVMADGKRAMRLVRSMAKELGVSKIGIMGFSAGGVLADMVQYGSEKTFPSYTQDAIDKLSEKPDFQILIYPGAGSIPAEIPADTAPAFMLVSNLDPCCSQPVVELISKFRAAKVPMEAHIYANDKHGFNMGNRSQFKSINKWPERLADWLLDMGYLAP